MVSELLYHQIGSNESFTQREILPRAEALVQVIREAIAMPWFLAWGTAWATLAIVPYGAASLKNEGKYKMVHESISLLIMRGANGISDIYEGMLKFINPQAEREYNMDGIVTGKVLKSLTETADALRASKNIFKKEVASRVVNLASVLVPIATRIAELAFGIIFAVASLLLLGTNKDLNSLAYGCLKAPWMINDIYNGLVRTINPSVKVFGPEDLKQWKQRQ